MNYSVVLIQSDHVWKGGELQDKLEPDLKTKLDECLDIY